MEVSAKTGLNIEKLFTEVAKELLKRDGFVSTCRIRERLLRWAFGFLTLLCRGVLVRPLKTK